MFGLFFCFLGKKFIKVTEIISGVILVGFVSMYLMFSNIQIQYSSLEFWLVIIVSIALGLIAGYFISKLEWLPPTILGGFLGYILGIFLYDLMFKYITSNATIVFWIIICLCVIAGVITGYFLDNHVIVLSTSFIGGYSVMRVIKLKLILGNELDDWTLS